jgi:hypothetical protein
MNVLVVGTIRGLNEEQQLLNRPYGKLRAFLLRGRLLVIN